MKRIVFFIGEFSEGGAERVISILANHLVQRGFSVQILKYFPSENFYFVDERIKITSVVEQTKTESILKNLSFMSDYFKKNADIVISFLAKFNMLALVANRKNHTPTIVCDRNDPRYTPTSSMLRKARDFLYQKADAVVLQTKYNQAYFNEKVQKKSIIIENPIDLKEYAGKALQTEKENIIVSAGRLEAQKNQKMLIEAFAEIKSYIPDYRLVIYGEGPYRSELEAKIKSLHLEDSIYLPGKTNELFNKLLPAKLFVLSFNYEGMPNALIEAMCLGLPCISTRVSGATELIENGKNGLLIDVNDKVELVDDMRQVLRNQTLSNKLANGACELNETLKVEKIVDKWVKLIEKYEK